MISKIELAYRAGFVDGEGYIGIKKYDRYKEKGYSPTYSEKVSVAGINEKVVKSFNEIVPGYVNFHKPSKLSKRGYWSWEVTEKQARKFLTMIYPYLRVKQPEAKILLLLSKNKVKTNSCKISQKDRDLREGLYLQIKNLHTFII